PLTLQAVLRAQAKEVDGGRIDPRLQGATLVELPERFRQQGLFGVVASKVAPGSRAAASGLRAGDRIGQVNRANVADLPAFSATLAAPPRELVLSVARGNRFGYLVMQ
ncbi:MAG: PDZ domain-containing protein, partial [Arenimonas sp.]|nr:PDZ domain-containing protein [Arenimonas sp.]